MLSVPGNETGALRSITLGRFNHQRIPERAASGYPVDQRSNGQSGQTRIEIEGRQDRYVVSRWKKGEQVPHLLAIQVE